MITNNSNLGWQWSFYFMAIFMAAGFLLLLFFVPETAYRRASYLNTDMDPGISSTETLASSPPNSTRGSHEKMTGTTNTVEPPAREKTPWIKTLSPFNGRKTDESFFKLLIRPFPLFLHPAIIWAMLIQGVMIGWTVSIRKLLLIGSLVDCHPRSWSESSSA
jgi:MFS family permease